MPKLRLTNLQASVFPKMFTDDEQRGFRKALTAGLFPLDFTVRIFGKTRILPPRVQRFTGGVPWEAIATVALDALNEPTRTSVMLRVAAAKEHGTCDELIEQVKPEVADMIEAMKETTVQKTTPIVKADHVSIERVA